MAAESLQRSGAGLWFSPCGRLAARRLPTGKWAVSSVGAMDRVGGYTAKIARSIVYQRFSSLTDARGAMMIALEMAEEQAILPEISWENGTRTTHKVKIGSGGDKELQIDLKNDGSLWKIHAGPVRADAAEGNPLLEEIMMQRLSYFLGQARTRKEAQRIVAQELSLPWPDIRS